MSKNLLNVPGIYQIRNKIDGNIYIGSTKNFDDRHTKHFGFLRRNKHHNIHLQRAWNRYGEDNFIFESLIICDVDSLLLFEQLFIDSLNPQYNIAKIAGRNSPTLGKHLSDEHKLKISSGSKGHKKSEETKKKMSESLKGNKRWLGKTIPIETRQKISSANRGRKVSIEIIEKASKLKYEDVKNIRTLLESGERPKPISTLYGVTISMICRIRDRKAWNF